jgi:inner membrane protein
MPEVQAPPTLPKSQPFFARCHSTILKLLGVGALSLVIVFTAFFLFEVTMQQKIHAFQYLMIGAVLCLFYLLLLSISEFIGFSWAYLIAAVASKGLITWYSRFFLGGEVRNRALFVLSTVM